MSQKARVWKLEQKAREVGADNCKPWLILEARGGGYVDCLGQLGPVRGVYTDDDLEDLAECWRFVIVGGLDGEGVSGVTEGKG